MSTDGWKKTRFPGLYQRGKEFKGRITFICPKTERRRERQREFGEISQSDALIKLAELRNEGEQASVPQRQRFGDYAVSLLEAKVKRGEIKSAAGLEHWKDTLENHLVPAFGDWFLSTLTVKDVTDWLTDQVGRKWTRTYTRKSGDSPHSASGVYSPVSINGWLSKLKVITSTATREGVIDKDPCAFVEALDTSLGEGYTDEQPNSLTAAELRIFLSNMQQAYPQHYAFVSLGFATGRRPSELRPLRRSGTVSDIAWPEGVLLIRRSHTRGQVMETTKNAVKLRLPLPVDMMDILREHDQLLTFKGYRGELLFPGDNGSFRSASCLDRPFREVAEAAGIKKHITPKAMRRTYQDLCRAAGVRDIVTRSISGHLTEEMQHHYSTVSMEEKREAVAKVIELAGFRKVG